MTGWKKYGQMVLWVVVVGLVLPIFFLIWVVFYVIRKVGMVEEDEWRFVFI